MLLDDDFNQYERDYIKRIGGSDKTGSIYPGMIYTYAKAIREVKQKALDSSLDEWDYAILETIRRDDYSAPLKYGTLRTYEALLKLHCHGMIIRMERDLTFDEQERVQAWLDSAIFKQYKARLKRIMTKKVKARLKIISYILGLDDKFYMLELTDAGIDAARLKRAEIAAIYDTMCKQYARDSTMFHKDAESYEKFLPTLLIMGFMGASTGAVLAASSSQYSVLVSEAGYAHVDLFGSNGDFDAGGFEFGG